MLTKTQIKRIQKAMSMGKGVDIKISKSQIRKVTRHGGSLWSSLAGLSSKILPMTMPIVKKAAPVLFTGALSGLASLGIDKLFGKGQTGGFMIPNSKVNQLIQYKDMLTTKQKQNILNALQTGSNVHIKPTKVQMGNGIGLPMLLDAIKGKGLQVDRMNRSRRSLPVYIPPKSHQKGKALVNPRDLVSPPFFRFMGSNEESSSRLWNDKKETKKTSKNQRRRSTSWKGQPIQKYPPSKHTIVNFINKPLSKIRYKTFQRCFQS